MRPEDWSALFHLENENHPEDCAEGELCEEKADSEDENNPYRNVDEDGHWICF